MLDEALSEQELFESLVSLKDNKSPGPDGLTKEFYAFFWEDIKRPYLECVEEMKNEVELSEMQKKRQLS